MFLSFFPLGCSFLFVFLSFVLSFFLSLGVAVQLSLPSFMLSSFFLFLSFCPLGCRFTAVFVRFFLSVWVEPYKYLLFEISTFRRSTGIHV